MDTDTLRMENIQTLIILEFLLIICDIYKAAYPAR